MMDSSHSKDDENNHRMTAPLSPIYIVILNWNLPGDTVDCIHSVLNSVSPDMHIVMVDNGSHDNSVNIIRQHFGTSIELLENKTNLGFAGGVNVGLRHALEHEARSILILNNDTIIDASMINRLVETAENHPNAGLIGPVIYYYSDKAQRIWRVGDLDLPIIPIPMRLSDRRVTAAGHTDFRLGYITACGMLIRRQVLEAIGLFDERYFMYYEDADFCQRAKNAGFEIWCSPQAKMWHKVSLSSQKQEPARRYFQTWGRAEFYRTYQHGFSWVILLVYLVGRAILLTIKDVFSHSWNVIHSTWQGLWDALTHQPAMRFTISK